MRVVHRNCRLAGKLLHEFYQPINADRGQISHRNPIRGRDALFLGQSKVLNDGSPRHATTVPLRVSDQDGRLRSSGCGVATCLARLCHSRDRGFRVRDPRLAGYGHCLEDSPRK